MSDTINQAIEKVAHSLTEICSTDISKDIYNLVTMLGGEIKVMSHGESPYCSVRKTGATSFIMTIPSDLPTEQARFAIARELGHLFLHLGYLRLNSHDIPDLSASAQEHHMTTFANCLLMPRKTFTHIVGAHVDGTTRCVDTKSIAKYFDVPESAVINYGRYLGIFA